MLLGSRRSVARMDYRYGRVFFSLLITLTLAVIGCNGQSTTVLTPRAAPTLAGSGPIGQATPPGATLTGTLSAPQPLATPAGITGALTPQQLELLLDAA